MKTYTCIIAEDEPLAQKQMQAYLSKHTDLELLKTFSNGLDALKFLENNTVDIVFFDIQMPQLSGMELAKMARKMNLDFKLVFTTAYSEFAVESYKVEASDYLLKPFSQDELDTCLSKLKQTINNQENIEKDLSEQDIEWDNEYIFVKSNYQMRKIALKDILFFEGLKDYIQIFLKDEKHPVLILTSFKKVLEKLPSQHFMRIHRSFIVNLNAVEKVEKSRIIFGERYLPVSESNKEKFFQFLQKNMLG